jgi:hypothetical protein
MTAALTAQRSSRRKRKRKKRRKKNKMSSSSQEEIERIQNVVAIWKRRYRGVQGALIGAGVFIILQMALISWLSLRLLMKGD